MPVRSARRSESRMSRPLAAIPAGRRVGLAACGGDSSASGSCPAVRAPRLLPERHPRHGDRRRQGGHLRQGTSARRKLEAKTFNAGPEAIEALLVRRASTPPTSGPNPAINAFAKSEGEAVTHHRRAHLRRRVLRGQAGRSRRPPTSRARRSPPRSSATPRTSRCATGSSSRASRPTSRAAATSDPARRTTPDRSTRSASGAIDGAWVPEPWATRLVEGRRQGPRRRARPVAGRQVRDHPPDRAHRVPRGHPDVVKALLAGRGRRDRLHQRPTRRGAETSATRSARSPASRSTPERDRRRVEDLTSPSTRSPPRSSSGAEHAVRGRPARRRSTYGHLRPDAAQRGAQGTRASRR